MTALTAADLKVGHIYSAKRPKTVGIFEPLLNDRKIIFISLWAGIVQYDSPTVMFGRHYPKGSIEAFLRWARDDVTALMPRDEWRRG